MLVVVVYIRYKGGLVRCVEFFRLFRVQGMLRIVSAILFRVFRGFFVCSAFVGVTILLANLCYLYRCSCITPLVCYDGALILATTCLWARFQLGPSGAYILLRERYLSPT